MTICFPADIASKGIQLDALEMVRRAERGVGLAIRKGQAEGTVRRHGENGGPQRDYLRNGSIVRVDPTGDSTKVSPGGMVPKSYELVDVYAMTDGVTDEQFDAAIGTNERPPPRCTSTGRRWPPDGPVGGGIEPGRPVEPVEPVRFEVFVPGSATSSGLAGSKWTPMRLPELRARHGPEPQSRTH